MAADSVFTQLKHDDEKKRVRFVVDSNIMISCRLHQAHKYTYQRNIAYYMVKQVVIGDFF